MIVGTAPVKVGHRQTPYTPAGINPPALKTPSQKEGVFYCQEIKQTSMVRIYLSK
jgi:hypothetical protein